MIKLAYLTAETWRCEGKINTTTHSIMHHNMHTEKSSGQVRAWCFSQTAPPLHGPVILWLIPWDPMGSCVQTTTATQLTSSHNLGKRPSVCVTKKTAHLHAAIMYKALYVYMYVYDVRNLRRANGWQEFFFSGILAFYGIPWALIPTIPWNTDILLIHHVIMVN